MSLKGLTSFSKDYFGGAWTAPDPTSVDGRGALLAQDVRFFEKQVQTRYGWGVAISATAPAGNSGVSGMFNWISSLGNYLVWADLAFPPYHLYVTKVSDNPPTITQLSTGTISGGTPSWAPVGPRLYFTNWLTEAVTNNLIPGAAGPAVITYDGANFNFDKIIPGPASTTLVPATAPTEPGAGSVTAGLHNIGIRMQHRSGFLGRPGPDTSTATNPTPATFAPIKFTSAGAKNLNWTFTPGANWPADVVSVQLVMSPVNSPNQLFVVPGAIQAVTGGAATVVNITFSISDEALVSGAAALECTDALNFYTASATGQAYMACMAVTTIGNRMFYLSRLKDTNGNYYAVVFASNLGAYQEISISQHVLQLPNQLQIGSVFSVLGAIYLSGPHYSYYTQDNGLVPANWPQPTLVDGRRGTAYPHNVEVATSGQYAWIADKTGLYLFIGSFADVPISYNTAEWITFSTIRNSQFSIKDDPTRHRVIVHRAGNSLVYDYTKGKDPYAVRGGIWVDPSPILSSIELVQNDLVALADPNISAPEVWGGGATPSGGNLYIFREKSPSIDANLYRDDNAGGAIAVHAIYETNVLPEPAADGAILAHQAIFPQIAGSGSMSLWKIYSIDKVRNKALPTITLTATGTRDIQRAYLKSPGGFIFRVEMNSLDGYFILSGLSIMFSKYASHR